MLTVPIFARACIAILLLGSGKALATDTAGRRIIGFSQSGDYFAYEQFVDSALSYYSVLSHNESKIRIIRVRTVSALNSPVRHADDFEASVKGLMGNSITLEDMRRMTALAAAPLLERNVIDVQARLLGSAHPTDPYDASHMNQPLWKPLLKELDITLPDGRKATVSVLPHYRGKDGCARKTLAPDLDFKAFDLFLTVGGQRVLMHADLPFDLTKSLGAETVRCVTDYGIAEVYGLKSQNGTEVLAVLLDMEDYSDSWVGISASGKIEQTPDRRFLALNVALRWNETCDRGILDPPFTDENKRACWLRAMEP